MAGGSRLLTSRKEDEPRESERVVGSIWGRRAAGLKEPENKTKEAQGGELPLVDLLFDLGI